MFGRRQHGDERDGAGWDQADGRSDDFVDPWADQDRNRPPSGDGYWQEPDDRAVNGRSNGQRRAAGPAPGGPAAGGRAMAGQGFGDQGYADPGWDEPRPGYPGREDGPFQRRPMPNDQRDNFRGGPREAPRDNPRDGVRDNGVRDNGAPGGRHSSPRPDWRERDADRRGQPEPEMPLPEFVPMATAMATVMAPPLPPGAAVSTRPVGRLVIFTLREDRAAEFDRIAEHAAEGVRTAEPDTLVYVYHSVPTLPMQRIVYEIYRDRAALESHQRQPHIQRFTEESKSCVVSSNVIDLRLKYAKVAPLQGAGQPRNGQPVAALPAGGQSPAGFSPGGGADAEPTARHRAPRPLETGRPVEAARPQETASRPLDDERPDEWFGEQAGPTGGRRRAEPADDWPPGRDWGRG
jgi:quinol monooxygenase YgiN